MVYVKLAMLLILLVAICTVGCVQCKRRNGEYFGEEESEEDEDTDDVTHENTMDELAAWDDKIGGTVPTA